MFVLIRVPNAPVPDNNGILLDQYAAIVLIADSGGACGCKCRVPPAKDAVLYFFPSFAHHNTLLAADLRPSVTCGSALDCRVYNEKSLHISVILSDDNACPIILSCD